jgi:predicted Zn-dependent protease
VTTGAELLALCKEALARAGEPEAEVFAKLSRRGFARFAMGELGQHMEVDEPLALVRVAKGARVAEASTTRLELASIVQAVRVAAETARHVPETEGFAGFAGAEPDGERPPRFSAATAGATAEDRVARLRPVLHAVRAKGLVSAGALETTSASIAQATTHGSARAHDATLASFKVWALETPGAGGAAGYGGHAHRDLGSLDLEGETARAIEIALRSKDPGALDAGTYDVVMEPPAVSELLEWLGSIAFGAPEVEQATSPMAGRIGERITGESITIDEDPLDPSDLGLSAPFDREGTWRRRVPLVERGVAREVLYDRTYAARMGAKPTGSALPDGVGACSLHMSAGDAASSEDLVRGMDRGLYICRLHYVNGLLEPRRAVMTGLTRDGCFLVEKGKITRAVGNMRLTDSFLEALARADGMTRARRAIPTWWSEAGACVVPAVRMRAVVFNGKSQERPRLD